jgi:hypothetical protein
MSISAAGMRNCATLFLSLSSKDRHPLTQFGFERALGFGWGHWDFIVEENVDEVFQLFKEVIAYSVELPDRIQKAVR